MNLLAHALLAYATLPDENGETCTGALMADFFAGEDETDYPDAVRLGMSQHRAIDAFTDSHPGFMEHRRAISEAGAPRHTAGILADIFWDHVLASEWDAWGAPLCGLGLEPFCGEVYERLERAKAAHSPSFARAYRWIAGGSWLSAYRTVGGIEVTLSGLSARMSGRPDLASAVAILVAEDGFIRETFYAFWPELVDFARRWAGRASALDTGS